VTSIGWTSIAWTSIAGPSAAFVPPPPPPPPSPYAVDGLALRRVRQQVARIIEGTAPAIRERGLAPRFRLSTESSESAAPVDSRRFYFASEAFGSIGPWQQAGHGDRRRDTMRIVVCYRDDFEDGVLEEIMSADYDAISVALLTSAHWDTPTSGLLSIGDGAPVLLPATLRRRRGGRDLAITVPIEYRRRAAP
jgi:hypothetical protein